jgi:hypothetical protein
MPEARPRLDYAEAPKGQQWRRWFKRATMFVLVIVAACAAWVVWPRVATHVAVLRAQELVRNPPEEQPALVVALGPDRSLWRGELQGCLPASPLGNVLHRPQSVTPIRSGSEDRFVIASVQFDDFRYGSRLVTPKSGAAIELVLSIRVAEPAGLFSSMKLLAIQEQMSVSLPEEWDDSAHLLVGPLKMNPTDTSRFFVDVIAINDVAETAAQEAQRVRIDGQVLPGDRVSLAEGASDSVTVTMPGESINGMPLFPTVPDPVR